MNMWKIPILRTEFLAAVQGGWRDAMQGSLILDPYSLADEGKFVLIVSDEAPDEEMWKRSAITLGLELSREMFAMASAQAQEWATLNGHPYQLFVGRNEGGAACTFVARNRGAIRSGSGLILMREAQP